MIEVEGLSYASILDDISFSIEENEILMVVGENGCGKTTLIKALVSLIEYKSGSIMYKKANINTLTQKNKASIFSYIPQIKNIPDTLSVLECVLSGKTRYLHSLSMPEERAYDLAQEYLEYCHIGHLRDRLLTEISGGELQLVYVARSLMQDAKVMVMDEPCSYLDFDKQLLFLEIVKELKKKGKTFFISMHDPNLALRYADKILFMRYGKVYACISRKDFEFKKKCTDIYNQLFGNHFLYNKDADFLYWK